jgi:hypothetical protein
MERRAESRSGEVGEEDEDNVSMAVEGGRRDERDETEGEVGSGGIE